jgi:flagellar motility protein MotE (MotC chaperone)
MKSVRLLPAVILVGLGLLGLKGEGLILSAMAEGQRTSSADLLAQDTAPLPKDPAAEDPKSDSAAEVDVQSSLTKRRIELDAREADIAMRTQVLAAAEQRVDGKIAMLKQLQDQISGLLTQRDAEQQKQVASLVKTYSAMKPKDAARIFNSLPDDVLVPVAQQMKSDVLAPVLAAMTSDNAQRLTEKLANRLKLPETAANAITPPAAPAAVTPPAPQAGAKPAAQAPAKPAPQAAAKPAGSK